MKNTQDDAAEPVSSTEGLDDDYQILTAKSPYALEDRVNKAIRDGWRPIGGVARGDAFQDDNVMQAMVKSSNDGDIRRVPRAN